MTSTLIKQARIVNEGQVIEADLRIRGQRIDRVSASLVAEVGEHIVEAKGRYLLPGMIDDQVHFREPGLTHKGTIASESRAAVAGGITSYMEMPNVNPATTTLEALALKQAIAAETSYANYAFYLGATEDNLDDIKQLDPSIHCGVKVFMGASTGDLLVEAPKALEAIFRESPVLIATHCESGPIIANNQQALRRTKAVFDSEDHPRLRDEEACYASSSYAVSLAKKYGSELNVLHISTAKELSLFDAGPVANKHITAEACVHHLWFSDRDYAHMGNLIKCNPAIKQEGDRDALLQALISGQIDIVATDHAPHTLTEKQLDYEQAPAGLPLVQHALLSLLEHVRRGRLTVSQLVEKIAHNPAQRYRVLERGFIREGYYADLVLVDSETPTVVSTDNCYYHCGWSPFLGQLFSSSVEGTWVNGRQVYRRTAGDCFAQPAGISLSFR